VRDLWRAVASSAGLVIADVAKVARLAAALSPADLAKLDACRPPTKR